MSRQIALSQLTRRQSTNLLRELRGTPQAQTIYQKLSGRPGKLTLKLDDPN